MKFCKHTSFLLLLIFLSACGQIPSPVTETATVVQVPATVTLPSLPTYPPGSPLLIPTFDPNLKIQTQSPTVTMLPSPTPTPTQTPLPLPAEPPQFPLDGYVMLFSKDGDLYFQDEENTPIKLTHVGGKAASSSTAILSDDGEKVVFFREGNYGDIYSINTDGSHEQLIVKDRPLAEYTGIYSQFIPNTHILLFNTYQCETQGGTTLCATGVSSVDTDTTEIEELVKPDKVGLYTTISNFSASPDGKLIAVEYPGYIDILDINGKAIRRNVIPYTSGVPSINGISLLPNTFWLPDSSGLIVIVPDGVALVGGFDVPAYSVWRYDMDTAAATRISLTPSLVYIPGGYICSGYNVSPDRKWILYFSSEDYTSLPFYDLDEAYALYIGNLHNGQAQRYDIRFCAEYSWSPDSQHFLYGNILGAMSKPSIEIMSPNVIGWIDNFHFIFAESEQINASEIKIFVAEIRGDSVVFFDLGIPFFDLVTIKPKR